MQSNFDEQSGDISLPLSKKPKKTKLFGAYRIKSKISTVQSDTSIQLTDKKLTEHVTPDFLRVREEQSKHFSCNLKIKKEARRGTGKVIQPGQAIVNEGKDLQSARKDQKQGDYSRLGVDDQLSVRKYSNVSALENISAPSVPESEVLRKYNTERGKRRSKRTSDLVRPVGRLCTLGPYSPARPVYDSTVSSQERCCSQNALDSLIEKRPHKRRYTDRSSRSWHIGSASQPIQLDVDSDSNVDRADLNLSMDGDEPFEMEEATIWLGDVQLQVGISFQDTSMVLRKINPSLKHMRIPDELTIGYDEIERVLLKEANTIYKQCMVCLEHHSNILPELTQTDTITEVQEIRIVLCCEASEKFVTAIFSEKCASKLENNKNSSNELRSKEDIQKSESHDLAGNKINYCHLCKDQLMDKILFKFPFPPSKSDILTISRGDMDRLEPGCYLNDIIIDYYLRRLLRNQYATNAALQNAVFLLSTHFYAMLRAKTSSTSSKEKYSGYENVKTWNNLNKLFKSSLVFVPIHENLHWSLAIIVNPILAALESNDDGPQTWIILLDPLEEYHKKSTILQNLRNLLHLEWEQSGTLDTPYNTGRVKLAHLNAPLQDNYYDCGVYVIKYAEVILQNTVHILKDVNEHSDSGVISKSQLEKLIFADAFSPNDVDEMRRKIRDAMASDMLVYRQLIETR